MPFRSRIVAREATAAFAVVVFYLLTILLPLHQAAGMQRDFARLGYETVGTWSVCVSIAQNSGDEDAPSALKCPAAGVAKQAFASADPPPAAPAPQRHALAVRFAAAAEAPIRDLRGHFGQSRAPPIAV